MSTKQDYYEILGVSKTADASEIKRAYREMAKKYHPDINPDKDAEQKFKECSEAYEVLKDPQKKAAYDRYGHDAFTNGAGQGGGFGGFSQGGFGDMSDLADIFSDFFGGGFSSASRGSQRSSARRGEDILEQIKISLKDAYTGIEQKVTIHKKNICSKCHGTGCEGDSHPETCPHCKGRGKIRMQQGFFMFEQTCPHCNGEGQVIKNPCTKCHGYGLETSEKTLDLKVPAGIEDGMKMRVSNEGNAGTRGGANGDLYVLVTIKEHELFKREDADLYCTIPISMITATLGGKIKLTLIDESTEEIKIPAGTQTDTTFTLKNKGMPKLKSGGACGNLYIKVKVTTPTKLNQKQKDLLKEFAKISGDNFTSASGFMDKVKEFLDL